MPIGRSPATSWLQLVIIAGLCAGTPAHAESAAGAQGAGPAEEGSQMLVAFLLLAGLLLWATGHMILR